GSRSNARIRYNVEAGKRYIAKVRGYDNDTGEYGFRAYMRVQVRLTPDEYEPDNDAASAKQIEIGVPQQHTFHTSNDVDWVKFQITQPGRYIIRARGVNSNRLDTYIELFDSNVSSIDEDDDGGEGVDSRLALHLESGLYYLKVECLDENPSQPYIISIESEAAMGK
ncbi:MAG: DVUA0089 family protein, partial [Treponema sp.]|nr:DVUA0089 family protein [Treponema sp.]